MPHSASLPTMMGHPDESPFESSRSRRSSLSSQHSTSTPKKQKSTYNHPYLIHSSSSAVLSRTNTSPVVNYTALPPSTPGHRTSKSMGFLRASQSVDDLRSPEKPGRDGSNPQTKGGSGYTSYTPPVRRKLVNRYSVSNLSDLAPREEKDVIAEKESERKTGKLDMGVWEWKMGVKAETVPTRDLPVSCRPSERCARVAVLIARYCSQPNPKLWNGESCSVSDRIAGVQEAHGVDFRSLSTRDRTLYRALSLSWYQSQSGFEDRDYQTSPLGHSRYHRMDQTRKSHRERVLDGG